MIARAAAAALIGLAPSAWSVAYASGAAPDWSRLAAWDGRYPTERIGTDERPFFSQGDVAAALARLLPAGELRRALATYTLADRFTTVDRHLLTDLCRPHDCGAENATFVFDLDGPDVWVAIFEHRGGTISTTWRGTKDHVDLPASVLAAVLAVHRPAP